MCLRTSSIWRNDFKSAISRGSVENSFNDGYTDNESSSSVRSLYDFRLFIQFLLKSKIVLAYVSYKIRYFMKKKNEGK